MVLVGEDGCRENKVASSSKRSDVAPNAGDIDGNSGERGATARARSPGKRRKPEAAAVISVKRPAALPRNAKVKRERAAEPSAAVAVPRRGDKPDEREDSDKKALRLQQIKARATRAAPRPATRPPAAAPVEAPVPVSLTVPVP